MNMIWRKMSAFLAMMVVLSLGLCGCGDSDSKKESTEKTSAPAATEASTTEEPEAGSEEETKTSDSGEGDDRYEYLKNLYDVGRMGLTEAGEGVYFASTSDGSNSMIVFANPDTLESGSFVGPATVSEDGEHITITDETSGLSLTFSVTEYGEDAWLLDMGDLGQAVLGECSVSECIDALKDIDAGTIPQF